MMLDDHKIAASSTEEARSVDPNSDYEFFGKHEIKSGIQLPCYKESHGKWMVPITILQKVHFPNQKLSAVEHAVSVCTKKSLENMTKLEIRKMKTCFYKKEGDFPTNFTHLTETEFACSTQDLDKKFQNIEEILLDTPSRKQNDGLVKTKKFVELSSNPSSKALPDKKNSANKEKFSFQIKSHKPKGTFYRKQGLRKSSSVEKHEETIECKKPFVFTKQNYGEKTDVDNTKQDKDGFKHLKHFVRDQIKIEVKPDLTRSNNKHFSKASESNGQTLQSVVFVPPSNSKPKQSSTDTSDCKNTEERNLLSSDQIDTTVNKNNTASCFSHVLDELENEQLTERAHVNKKAEISDNSKRSIKTSQKLRKTKPKSKVSKVTDRKTVLHSDEVDTEQSKFSDSCSYASSSSKNSTSNTDSRSRKNKDVNLKMNENKGKSGLKSSKSKLEKSSYFKSEKIKNRSNIDKSFPTENQNRDNHRIQETSYPISIENQSNLINNISGYGSFRHNRPFPHVDMHKSSNNCVSQNGSQSLSPFKDNRRNDYSRNQNRQQSPKRVEDIISDNDFSDSEQMLDYRQPDVSYKHYQTFHPQSNRFNENLIHNNASMPFNTWKKERFHHEKEFHFNNSRSNQTFIENDFEKHRPSMNNAIENGRKPWYPEPLPAMRKNEPTGLENSYQGENWRYENSHHARSFHTSDNWAKPNVTEIKVDHANQFPNENWHSNKFQYENIPYSNYYKPSVPVGPMKEPYESYLHKSPWYKKEPLIRELPKLNRQSPELYQKQQWVDNKFSNYLHENQDVNLYPNVHSRTEHLAVINNKRSFLPPDTKEKFYKYPPSNSEFTNQRKTLLPTPSVKYFQDQRYKSVRKAQMLLRRSMSKSRNVPSTKKFGSAGYNTSVPSKNFSSRYQSRRTYTSGRTATNNNVYNKLSSNYFNKALPSNNTTFKNNLQPMVHSVDELIQWGRSQTTVNSDKTFQTNGFKEGLADFSKVENVGKDSPVVVKEQKLVPEQDSSLEGDSLTKQLLPPSLQSDSDNLASISSNMFVTLDEEWDMDNESETKPTFDEDSMEKEESLKQTGNEDQMHWPFDANFTPWDDVFGDFSLETDKTKKASDLTAITKGRSSIFVKGDHPFQWKKKLIRKAETHGSSKNASANNKCIDKDVKCCLDEIIQSLSENVLSKKPVPTSKCTKKNPNKPSLKNNRKKTKKNISDKQFSTVQRNKKRASQSSVSNDYKSSKKTVHGTDQLESASKKTLSQDDVEQLSAKQFKSPKQSDDATDTQDHVDDHHANIVEKKSVDETSKEHSAFESYSINPQADEIVTNGPSNLIKIKKEPVDFDISDEQEEKSSDDTLSDSEIISLRSYAKIPVQKKENHPNEADYWNLKNCFVSIECLNLFGAHFDSGLDGNVETVKADESTENIQLNNKWNSNANSNNSSVQKARKTIRNSKPLTSRAHLDDVKEIGNLGERVERNNCVNQTGSEKVDKNVNSQTLIQTDAKCFSGTSETSVPDFDLAAKRAAPKNSSISRNSNSSKSNDASDDVDVNIASRLRSKRRARLPSMSSDEENFTPQSQDADSRPPSRTVETPENVDDEALLVSCKPFISKSFKIKLKKPGLRKVKIKGSRKSLVASTKTSIRRKFPKKADRKNLTELPDFLNSLQTSQSSVKSWVNANISPSQDPSAFNNRSNLENSFSTSTEERIINSNEKSFENADTSSSSISNDRFVVPVSAKSNGSAVNSTKSLGAFNGHVGDSAVNSQAESNISLPLGKPTKNHSILSNSSSLRSKSYTPFKKSVSQAAGKRPSVNSTLNSNTKNFNHAFDSFKFEPTVNTPIKLSNSRILIASVKTSTSNLSTSIGVGPHNKNSTPGIQSSYQSTSTINTTLDLSQPKTVVDTTQRLSVSAVNLSKRTDDRQANSKYSVSGMPSQPSYLLSTLQQNSVSSAISSEVEDDTILSPTPKSLYGETYHHGMMEIQLSAPPQYLDPPKMPSQVLSNNKIVFTKRRIPYIQLKVQNLQSVKILLTKTNLSNIECNSTVLVRIRDVAFSLRIDCIELLNQISSLGIACYMPNDYTVSVYQYIYNNVAKSNQVLTTMLGLHRPLTSNPINEDSMISLNDYLKIILPIFYHAVFGLVKSSLPEFVSVTTYKPVDVVTKFIVSTFSTSYAHNLSLIDGDVRIKKIPTTTKKTGRKPRAKRKPANVNGQPGTVKTQRSTQARKTRKRKQTTVPENQPAVVIKQQRSASFEAVSLTPNLASQPVVGLNISQPNMVPVLLQSQPNFNFPVGAVPQLPPMQVPSSHNAARTNDIMNRISAKQNFAHVVTSSVSYNNYRHHQMLSRSNQTPIVNLNDIRFVGTQPPQNPVTQSSTQRVNSFPNLSPMDHEVSHMSRAQDQSFSYSLKNDKTLGARFVEDSSHVSMETASRDLHTILQSIKRDDSTNQVLVNATSSNCR